MNGVTSRETQLIPGDVHGDGIAFGERAFKNAAGQGVQQPLLERALQRTRPIYRIITLTDQEVLRGVGQLDSDLPVAETFQEAAQLDLDNIADVRLLQRVEEH